jgi:hypothetical protein
VGADDLLVLNVLDDSFDCRFCLIYLALIVFFLLFGLIDLVFGIVDLVVRTIDFIDNLVCFLGYIDDLRFWLVCI